jgi:sec-independent protein translocase protein TatB
MFEIGWSEILVIALVAIVVIGPKDLPRAMRVVGQWTGKVKRMGREFQNQFNEALREAELDGVQKDLTDIVKSDPLGDVRNQMTKLDTSLRSDIAKPATPAEVPVAPAVAAEPAAVPAVPAAKAEP